MFIINVWVVIALTAACPSPAGAAQARFAPVTASILYPGENIQGSSRRGNKVIGSSEQVHVVDALAITGDEGRSSLRKAAGSRQTGFDPQMSEWGNPARKGHPWLNT